MHLFLLFLGIYIHKFNVICQSSYGQSNISICVIPEEHTKHLKPHVAYSYLKSFLSLGQKCHHIYGNLNIVNLDQDENGTDPDLSFLSTIEEISGSLVIHGNSVKRIPLTSLKVIRGLSSNKKYALEIYFNYREDKILEEIDLRNLRVIMNKNVFMTQNPGLGYLKYKVDWNQILEDTSKQKFIMKNNNDSENQTFLCHKSCEFWVSSYDQRQQYCFGPSKDECQPRMKCSINKDHKWCQLSGVIEIPCNHECAGGCHGKTSADCVACNTLSKNSICTNTCTPKHNLQFGKDNPETAQDKFIYSVGGYCSDRCPDALLDQNKICIYECNFKKYYKSGNRCIECPNGDCDNQIPGNNICDLSKLDPTYPTDDRRYVLKKNVLEKLTNCNIIIGALSIYDDSFSKYGLTTSLLKTHLKNVREIIGELTIILTYTQIESFSFLSNLMEIRKSVRIRDPTYPLKIHANNLKFLGLKKLTKVYSSLIIYADKDLCYVNKIPWTEITQFSRIFSTCNASCHPLCTRGCWGPGNDLCYSCSFLEAGEYCVKQCSDSPGYYSHQNTNSGKIECRKCHPFCKQNCTGPSAKDCNNQCKFVMENGVCVKTCSMGYYSDSQNPSRNIQCIKCHNSCYFGKYLERRNSVCTGPLNILGLGGCSFCNKIIKNERNQTICHKGPCPYGYVKSAIPDSPDHNIRIVQQISCEPCHPLCKNCTGLNNHISNCIQCSGYVYNNHCVSSCPNEVKNYASKIEIGTKCPTCHKECKNGCLFVDDNNSCQECANKKMYHKGKQNKFSCVKNCPVERNYTEYRNRELLCLSWEETSVSHQQKMTTLILAACMTSLALLFVFILIYFKWKSDQAKIKAEIKALYSNYKEPNMKNMKDDYLKRPPNMNKLQMISISNLIFNISDKPLGSGAFGKVYKGYWRVQGPNNKVHNLDVVIKVIHNSSKSSIDEFLEEAKIMASVTHRHCLPLIGVCLSLSKPCLVSAYAEFGSLDKYLHQNKKKISSYSMLKWAEQIADGMAYLTIRNIIHRDLASRNVLVNSRNIVQITDFGLAKLIDDSEKSIVIKSGHVPIRWLALETLLDATYSSATDVWAYGITLWEIFTYGKQPYEELNVSELKAYLQQGNRLCQPEISTLDIYMVMIKCWLEDPLLRPSFIELISIFEQFSQHPKRFLYLSHEHINEPIVPTKNHMMITMNQLAMESEFRSELDAYKNERTSLDAEMFNNDNKYQTEENSYLKYQNEEKWFLPKRKKTKRQSSLNRIKKISKFILPKFITNRFERNAKHSAFQLSRGYHGNKSASASFDSILPLLTHRTCDIDTQSINPKIAKIQKEMIRNMQIVERTSKFENVYTIQKRIFVDDETKNEDEIVLEMTPVMQKSASKGCNLPPISIPPRQNSVIESRVGSGNQNKTSPDSGNSHNFDIEDYLIPSHLSSAGYYNLTPSPSPVKKLVNTNSFPSLVHNHEYVDDGYLEPKVTNKQF